MRQAWLSSFVAVGLVAALSSVASAGIDGIVTAGEYDHQWTVQGWNKQNSTVIATMPTATLMMRQDGAGNLYVALVLPQTYVDNSYGGSSGGSQYTSVDWTAPPSQKTTHNFSDLTGSDQATFLLKKNSTSFFAGDMDYLSQNNATDAWESGGFGTAGHTSNDGGLTSGTLAMVGGAQSSMGYNYLNGGETAAIYESHSPTLTSNTVGNIAAAGNPNWEYDVVYEFEILAGASTFTGNVLGGSGASSFLTNGFYFELTFVHASPNTFNDNNKGYHIVLTPQTPPAVPLPAAAWMGGLTMLGIAAEAMRRRRKNALLV